MNNLQGATDDKFELCCIWHHIIGLLDICCLIASGDCSNNCELSHLVERCVWPPNGIALKFISARWDAFKSLKLACVLVWLALYLAVGAGIVWVPPSSCAFFSYAAWWHKRARPFTPRVHAHYSLVNIAVYLYNDTGINFFQPSK